MEDLLLIVLAAGLVLFGGLFAVMREKNRKVRRECTMLKEQLKQSCRMEAAARMAGGAAHDFNNMLAGICGAAECLKKRLKGDEEHRYCDAILNGCEQASHLARQMTRLAARRAEKAAPVNLSACLKESLNLLGHGIGREMEIIGNFDAENLSAAINSEHLQSLILNLGFNSRDALGGRGRIEVGLRQVCLSEDDMRRNLIQAEPGEYAEISFADDGPGIDAENMAHIFEPFERERNSTVSGIQGTGLGMPITKNIVEMMGGTIEVTSSKGNGTEFIVEIPMKKVTSEAVEINVQELEGARALVVDDDFNTCDSVSNMLIQMGMRAEWTMSGREAILRTRQAVNRNDEYRVYVIDWLIPDMNGIEIARHIRKEAGDDVLIIIMTAYDWSDIEKEGKEAGVTAFCSKPLFISNLRKCLIDILYPKKEESNLEILKKERIKEHRLLLVEDNDLNREIASELLNAAGFITEEAENGRIAVDKLLEKGFGYYSAVLMDVQMPVMDGYEATKLIRGFEDKALSNIPIVAMTANAFEEDKKNAFDAGMNAHISKPIDVKKLLDTLNNDIL